MNLILKIILICLGVLSCSQEDLLGYSGNNRNFLSRIHDQSFIGINAYKNIRYTAHKSIITSENVVHPSQQREAYRFITAINNAQAIYKICNSSNYFGLHVDSSLRMSRTATVEDTNHILFSTATVFAIK